jgi:type I restriction enzyme S subunit
MKMNKENRKSETSKVQTTAYKQTELGLIPEDWEVNKIKNFAEIKTGGKNTQDRIENGIYPFFVRSQKVERINTFSFDGESVLTAGDGVGVGKVVHYINGKFDCHQRVYRISNFEEKVEGYYFYLYFRNNFYDRIMKMTAKSSVDSVRMEMIADMLVPFPPTKAEQTAIANALKDADAYIQSLEKLIEKKRNIKQGAMQELLKPKEGWVEISIHQIADNKKELFDDGDWIESEHITSEGIRLIQTGNIGIGTFIEKDSKKYINEASFKSIKCKELKIGDLLICRLAEPAGRSCILPDIGEYKIVTSVDVTIFRPRAEMANRIFLVNVFSTNAWLETISGMSGGTTHKRISRGALGRMKINLPSLSEQNRIGEILNEMQKEIIQIELKLSKAKQLKQGMMQELLTGKIRLV